MRYNELLAESWRPNDLEEYAREHQGMIYDTHEPGGGKASDYVWRYDPAYPISKPIDGLKPKARAQWMRDEIRNFELDGYPGRYDELLSQDIQEPVVAVEVNGETYLWDGNHRVGACCLTGRKTVPAVVGTPKADKRADISLSRH